MGVQIFDRILNGNNMFTALIVDGIDNCSKSRRFAAPRRAGNQDKSPRFFRKASHHRWQAKIIKAPDFKRDRPESPGHSTPVGQKGSPGTETTP